MNKRKILIGFILLALMTGIFIYFNVNKDDKEKIQCINKKDQEYVISHLENYTFSIFTKENNYTIKDIDGNDIECDMNYENNILHIMPKNLKNNVIYCLKLSENDYFKNEDLQDAKTVYFYTENSKISFDDFKYKLSVDISDEIIISNGIIDLGELEFKLSCDTIKENKTFKNSYTIYLDDNKVKNGDEVQTGDYHLKLITKYGKQIFEYKKKVRVVDPLSLFSDEELLEKANSQVDSMRQKQNISFKNVLNYEYNIDTIISKNSDTITFSGKASGYSNKIKIQDYNITLCFRYIDGQWETDSISMEPIIYSQKECFTLLVSYLESEYGENASYVKSLHFPLPDLDGDNYIYRPYEDYPDHILTIGHFAVNRVNRNIYDLILQEELYNENLK